MKLTDQDIRECAAAFAAREEWVTSGHRIAVRKRWRTRAVPGYAVTAAHMGLLAVCFEPGTNGLGRRLWFLSEGISDQNALSLGLQWTSRATIIDPHPHRACDLLNAILVALGEPERFSVQYHGMSSTLYLGGDAPAYTMGSVIILYDHLSYLAIRAALGQNILSTCPANTTTVVNS